MVRLQVCNWGAADGAEDEFTGGGVGGAVEKSRTVLVDFFGLGNKGFKLLLKGEGGFRRKTLSGGNSTWGRRRGRWRSGHCLNNIIRFKENRIKIKRNFDL